MAGVVTPAIFTLYYMRKENLTPEDSLQIIEHMINTARNRFSENGHLYLLWGWVVLICSLFHFAAIHFELMKHPELVWMLTWAAAIYQAFYLAKHKKQEKVKTYTDEINTYVWIAFVVMLFLLLFLMMVKNDWVNMYPFFLVLYGMPTFLSGILLRFAPLTIGGLVCWLLAIGAAFIQWPYHLLFLGLAIISGWIIPGYLLRSKYKSVNV